MRLINHITTLNAISLNIYVFILCAKPLKQTVLTLTEKQEKPLKQDFPFHTHFLYIEDIFKFLYKIILIKLMSLMHSSLTHLH